MELKERIVKGLDGEFAGLANGFNILNRYIYGTQKGCYYLLGGLSGTFKTTLVDYILLNNIRDAEEKGIELNIFYYSFEIDKLTKKCNWLSSIAYQKYGVVISPQKIKGLGTNRLTSDELRIIESEIPYVENLFSKIKFRFSSLNPTGIFKELRSFAIERGKIISEEYEDANGRMQEKVIGYEPNNPYAYNLVILDHLFLIHKERGFQTKEVLDKYSEYCVYLRNIFGFTFFNIQQFNQGLNSVDRQKFKGIDLSPSQNDFRDTTVPYTDADVVMGLMNPYKMDIDKCLDYDVSLLGQNMVMLKIIKNRMDEDNIAIGLYANPKAGTFEELPKPNKIIYKQYNTN